MKKFLPLALTIGLSAAAFAQDSNSCMCTNNGDMHTRVMNGKVVQEDKHTINVITPAPGQSTVTTYSSSYGNPDTTMYVAHSNDFSNNGDVKVRVDRNGTVVQTDKTTINTVKPAPADVAMMSNGYVMVPSSGNDVHVRIDKKGNIIQTDRTTINKITPAPSSMSSSTTVSSSDTMGSTTTTTTTTDTSTYGSTTPDQFED